MVNETGSPFWCSDNPIAYYNERRHDPLDGQGFERPGSQLYFPLSSLLVLAIVDPQRHPYSEKVSVSVPNVIFNNHLQVKNAERFIVSPQDNFTLAQRIIARTPSRRDQSQRYGRPQRFSARIR
jgi:hypothetical protein